MIRTTYCHPLRFRDAVNEAGEVLRTESGKAVQELVPGHETRPARPYEQNVWYEDADGAGE
jgi:hypothetical protein